jgi:hypothetical protein
MKWINVVAGFKHGYDTYYVGEKVQVSDEDAAHFVKHGWATAEGATTGTPDVTPKTLKVADGKHSNKEEKL